MVIVAQLVNILKPPKLCALKRWISWYLNYTSVKKKVKRKNLPPSLPRVKNKKSKGDNLMWSCWCLCEDDLAALLARHLLEKTTCLPRQHPLSGLYHSCLKIKELKNFDSWKGPWRVWSDSLTWQVRKLLAGSRSDMFKVILLVVELDLKPSVLFTWPLLHLFFSLFSVSPCANIVVHCIDLSLPETQIICHLPLKNLHGPPLSPISSLPLGSWNKLSLWAQRTVYFPISLSCSCSVTKLCIYSKSSAKSWVSWSLGLCFTCLSIFDLGTQGTVQFLELGRVQEILLEELIPFRTTAVFAQIHARNIPGVLSVGGYFVLHLFCWKTNNEFNLWL